MTEIIRSDLPRRGSCAALACAIAALAASAFTRTYAVTPTTPATVATAADFAALPRASGVTLSPNGNLLAWQDEKNGTQARIVVVDLPSKVLKWGSLLGKDETLASLSWADDDTLLATIRVQPQRRGYQTLAIDVTTGKARLLTPFVHPKDRGRGIMLLASRGPEPHTVVMSAWDSADDSAYPQKVFQIDTHSGEVKELAAGDDFTNYWVLNAQGEPIARSEWSSENGIAHFRIVVRQGNHWRRIYKRDGGYFTLIGLDATGTAIFGIESAPGKPGHLWEIPLDGSAMRDVLPGVNAQTARFVYERPNGPPVGVRLDGSDGSTIHWFSDAAKQRHDLVARAFPGRVVSIYDTGPDDRTGLAMVEGPASPPVYYLADFPDRHMTVLAESYPQLDHARLGTVNVIRYSNGKGATLAAEVTLPPGKSARNLPLVVLAPGGSEPVRMGAFDWFAQFLATRGYAVLRPASLLHPQFLLASLTSNETSRPGMGSWAGAIQDNLIRAMTALVKLGLADRSRVCIVGVDDGAYAAFAGAAAKHGSFACAVAINGISDFPAMYRYQQESFGATSGLSAIAWMELGDEDDSKAIAASPVHWSSQMTVPMLLLHSVDNVSVPLAQSKEMVDALTHAGKPVTLIKVDGSDNDLSTAQTRLQVMQDVASFLSKYLQ